MKSPVQKKQNDKIGFWKAIRTIFICIIATIIICVQIYRFGEAFRYWWGTKEIRQTYIQEIEKLEKQQEAMKIELDNLKNSSLTKERFAREMGYAKPGEMVYRFKTKD